MRAWLSFLIVGSFLTSGPSHAANLIDDDTFALVIGSYAVGDSGRMIQACDSRGGEKVCTVYPSAQALAFGFKGGTSDWEKFFNRCMAFELNNVATDVTLGISTLALFGQLSFVKALIAGAATGLATSAVLPSAYPAIKAQEVAGALQFVDYALLARDEQVFVPTEVVTSMKSILDSCSWRFSEWMKESHHNRCMRGCHGG